MTRLDQLAHKATEQAAKVRRAQADYYGSKLPAPQKTHLLSASKKEERELDQILKEYDLEKRQESLF